MPEYPNDTNPGKRSSVLITGGSGLVGKYMTSVLLSVGYKVSHLSRNGNQFGKVRVFRWEPEKGILDPVVFEGVDYIVHLAGANIGEKRWSVKRKKEIENSRIDSSKLLFKTVSENRIRLKAFISASAVGYYGSVTSDKIFKEDDQPAYDFLGFTCKRWEEAADLFANTGARVIKIRTGVVMEKSNSALSKLLKLARLGVFPRLGNGSQYMPWIHIADLCGIYLKAIEDKNMIGVYNAVSPYHVTHNELISTLARKMGKPIILPPIPAFILRTILGEMSELILNGSRISSQKITKAGYCFVYGDLQDALCDLLSIE